MANDVKWIKITTGVFDDEKMLMIESMPSADSIIVIWFKLLTLAGKQNNDGVFMMSNRIAYTDEMLAAIFRRDLNTVKLALNVFQQFGMIEVVENVITIPNWGKHQSLDAYEKKKARDRDRIAQKRAAQKALVAGLSPDSRTTVAKESPSVAFTEREEEKERDIEEEKECKRETTHTLFKRLVADYVLPSSVQAKMAEWIKYKTERKEPYKEQGMKSLLRQVERQAQTHGDQAVCNLIDECMASNWKGIIFDRLNQKPAKQYQKQTKADELNDFYGMAADWAAGD